MYASISNFEMSAQMPASIHYPIAGFPSIPYSISEALPVDISLWNKVAPSSEEDKILTFLCSDSEKAPFQPLPSLTERVDAFCKAIVSLSFNDMRSCSLAAFCNLGEGFQLYFSDIQFENNIHSVNTQKVTFKGFDSLSPSLSFTFTLALYTEVASFQVGY